MGRLSFGELEKKTPRLNQFSLSSLLPTKQLLQPFFPHFSLFYFPSNHFSLQPNIPLGDFFFFFGYNKLSYWDIKWDKVINVRSCVIGCWCYSLLPFFCSHPFRQLGLALLPKTCSMEYLWMGSLKRAIWGLSFLTTMVVWCHS